MLDYTDESTKWAQRRIASAVLGGSSLASSRVRAHMPLEYVRGKGAETEIFTASDSRWWAIRLVVHCIVARPDTVHIQKLAPAFPFSYLIRSVSNFLVYELDDAIYFGYPNMDHAARRRYNRRVRRLTGLADRLVASTPVIADDLKASRPEDTIVFPGPAPAIPNVGDPEPSDRRMTIWLGSPSTLHYMNDLREAFDETDLSETLIGRLVIVGSQIDSDMRVMERIWSPEVERHWLNRSRVGVMPIDEDQWSKRKAAYKLLVYLANDIVPVIARNSVAVNLLGDSLEKLCKVVQEPCGTSDWLFAIGEAYRTPPTAEWKELRDRFFDSISITRFVDALFDLPVPTEIR